MQLYEINDEILQLTGALPQQQESGITLGFTKESLYYSTNPNKECTS